MLFTYLARIVDGLVLVASQEHAAPAGDMETCKQQAKMILKTLSHRSPQRMSIDSGPYVFNYVIDEGVCFMSLCERTYPKRLCFAFLDEIREVFFQELQTDYGDRWRAEVAAVARPYAYIKFDKHIQRLRKQYADPDTSRNQSKLSSDLADVQNIMKKNIAEVLERGDRLDHVAKMSQQLRDDSKRWHWGARKLNLMEMYKKYLPCVFVVMLVAFVGYMYW